jgi:para-nitrobenzyl esterase
MAAAPVAAIELEVAGEKLVGQQIEGTDISVFRGIPFAEPPTGDLRWQAPQPLHNKLATRDATQFAPACMQQMGILEWYRDMAEWFGSTRDEFGDLAVSEDCLYLNIWTPNLDDSAELPVMVYIHGGSNDSGWAYEPDYHGHVLAERGVVLVSIAYRLGVFGFFAHPEIEGEAQANFGLWDQVAALEWIQENIARFGGDPDRVTIFGESAGAQDVLALMTSPVTDELFHGGIMQSNAGFGLGQRTAASLGIEQQRGVETAKVFGFEGPGSLAKLKAVPADELLQKYTDAFPSYYHAPAVDGVVVDKSIWETIDKGELGNRPFIIGNNDDEWHDLIPADADAAALDRTFISSTYINTDEAKAHIADEASYRRAIDRVATANGMTCPTQYLAARYDSAWVYHFTRIREGKGGEKLRAYHGAELPYTFGTHPSWMPTTDVDRVLTDQILGYWTAFAATGNPNAEGLPKWPTFMPNGKQVMEFGDAAQVKDAPEPVLCRIFWQSVTANR